MDKKYLLQLGLAIVLLYAGINSFSRPFDWVGYVPVWVSDFGLSRELALHLHASLEILLGILFLANQKIRWVAYVTAADMAIIIFANGFDSVFLVTFRDVGLFFMALYLAVA